MALSTDPPRRTTPVEIKRSVAAWDNGAHADIERYRKLDSRGQMDMRERITLVSTAVNDDAHQQ